MNGFESTYASLIGFFWFFRIDIFFFSKQVSLTNQLTGKVEGGVGGEYLRACPRRWIEKLINKINGVKTAS